MNPSTPDSAQEEIPVGGPSPSIDDEIGSLLILPRTDIDIVLVPSRDRPIAGELWSVAGEIHNRSTIPVWLADSKTALTLAPEMWGQTSTRGSMAAFFPTIPQRQSDEIVRLEPGAKYTVVWKVDTFDRHGGSETFLEVFRRILSAVKDFTFFNPGKFAISANVHVWPVLPKLSSDRKISNLGESFTVCTSREVEMEASPWVLILGAGFGGVLCFILQTLFGLIHMNGLSFSTAKTLLIGFSSAILLSGVVTVLVSRLSKADFLLIIKINDIWGAITTGFIVQWFGFKILSSIIPSFPHTP